MSCGCLSPSNPDCLACPSTIKRLAAVGSSESNSIKHSIDMTMTLSVGEQSISIYERSRNFLLTNADSKQASNPVACVNTDGTAYFVGSWDTSSTAGLKEQYSVTSTKIRYLDLRNNIAVYNQTIEAIPETTLQDDGVIQWNSDGVVTSVHRLLQQPFVGIITEKEIIDETIIYEANKPFVAEFNEVLTTPPKPGQPQQALPDAFYLYEQHWEEDGGYDLFYPPWLRGIGSYQAIGDYDRDLHRAIYDNRFTPSMPLTSPLLTVEATQDATGSWAVDRDGNKFFSQSHLGGVYALIKTADGSIIDPATVVNISGGNQRFHPVAPV